MSETLSLWDARVIEAEPNEDSLVVLPGQVYATQNALVFSDDISFDDWQIVGQRIKKIEGAVHWWIGDWLNFGERKWGEMYSQALEVTDYEEGTLRNDKWIASTYELSRRRDNLSWSHHQEAASLSTSKAQDEILERAEVENWSQKQTREKVKQYREAMLEAPMLQPVPPEIVVKLGEWWKLGHHLLFCGDTSTQEFIDRLTPAAFAFADPPYGAGVAEWDNAFYWRHDYLIDKAEVVMVTPGIVSIFEFARLTAMPYKWSVSCWINNGMTRGAMGFGNWVYAALFAKSSLYKQAQDFFQTSIDISTTGDIHHKGRKPAGFLAKLIELYSEKGEFVIDPFLGSGTTLFVCEEMGRACIGGDISPEYCSDIVKRWEKLTGQQAVKVG